jgi:hypothetical protein
VLACDDIAGLSELVVEEAAEKHWESLLKRPARRISRQRFGGISQLSSSMW